MDLFPPVPVRNYRFGAAATPTLIQLRDYGIVGLKDHIFHFSEYIDDHGMVCHAVTLDQSWGSYFMKVIYYILLVTFTKK